MDFAAIPIYRGSLRAGFDSPRSSFTVKWCWKMRNHQIDLEIGESIEIGSHTVTLHRIDDDGQQAVLEIEDPDGTVEMVSVNVASLQAEEPVLV